MPTDLKMETTSSVAAVVRFVSGATRTATPDDVLVLGEGQLSIVLGFADLAFVFPRSEFARSRVLREAEVLSLIRPRLNAAVPEVVGVELEAPLGQAFVVRRLLPGSIVTSQRLAALDDAQAQRVAAGTAALLRELHQLADVVAGVVPTFASPTEFAEALKTEVERWLVPRMSTAQQARARRELEDLAQLETTRPTLCHTDLGGNIVFDDSSQRVGFIDFGSVMVADPVLDLASLSVLDSRFMTQLIDAYPGLGEYVQGVAVVSETFALQDALYGARQSDWSYVDDVLSQYQAVST